MSVRIHATDLRDAAKKAAASRADAQPGGGPVPEVLLDVEVIIEHTASAAFKVWESIVGQPECVRYVGTPRGLAGFISDIQKLGIADGVVLLTRDREHVIGLMLDEMATGLGATRRHVAA